MAVELGLDSVGLCGSTGELPALSTDLIAFYDESGSGGLTEERGSGWTQFPQRAIVYVVCLSVPFSRLCLDFPQGVPMTISRCELYPKLRGCELPRRRQALPTVALSPTAPWGNCIQSRYFSFLNPTAWPLSNILSVTTQHAHLSPCFIRAMLQGRNDRHTSGSYCSTTLQAGWLSYFLY